MQMLGRRAVVLGAAAMVGPPLTAQPDAWACVADRARALDQCRAIVIRQSGAEVLSQVTATNTRAPSSRPNVITFVSALSG